MIQLARIIEYINEPIKKISGISTTGEYVEIRVKDNILDVRASKEDGESMRILFKKELTEEESEKEILTIIKNLK